MSRQPSMTARLPSLATLAALALATGVACKPWTVRPIEDGTQDTAAASDRFDATAYVESIWTTRVLHHEAKTSSIELGPVMLARDLPARSTILVRGTGLVSRVDTRSRVGLAFVDLAPGDGRPDVSIQIGPVLRGTAVRDALPFIRFGDFANQLEFADVANALNARVLRSVLIGVDPASLEGRSIFFWGATKLDTTAEGRMPEVVPLILEGGTK